MIKKRIFYGWWVVTAAFGIIFVNAGIGFFSFGVFIKPFMEEFGWGRAQTSLGTSLAALMAGIASVIIGQIIGKYGARKIVIIGALLGSSTYFLLIYVNSLWQFYAIFILQGVSLGAAAGFIPVLTVVSRWFKKKRGRATGIAVTGIAAGALVFSPIVGYIVETFGWQTGLLFNGIVVLIIDIPLAIFILKEKPEDIGLLPDNEPQQDAISATIESPSDEVAVTNTQLKRRLSAYFKSPALWLLSFALLIGNIGTIGLVVHEVPHLTDIGLSATLAAGALGFTGAFGGLGNIVLGYLTERISVRYVMMLAFAIQAIGTLLLLSGNSLGMVWAFVVVFGFTFGCFATLMPLAVSAIFPPHLFASIYGFVAFMYQIGLFLGPPIAGLAFDITQSYSIAFISFIGAFIIAMIGIYFAWGGNPKPFRLT